MKKLIEKLAGKTAIVVGDIMVDEYIYGTTGRISREAPVLILEWAGRTIGPGGAANAVQNIKALGGNPIPVGVVGNDPNGVELARLFAGMNINTDSVIVSANVSTTSKTRIVAGGPHTLKQQVTRIDRNDPRLVEFGQGPHIVNALSDRIREADAILVSDYGTGAVSDRLIEYLNRSSARWKIPLIVDTRSQLMKFRRLSLATPNEDEARTAFGYDGDRLDEWEAVGARYLKETGSGALLVTRGSAGMILFEKGKKAHKIEIYGDEDVVDTTGAGDTVAAAATLSLAAGASPKQAAELANRAGGLVVMKKGAAVVSAKELAKACR